MKNPQENLTTVIIFDHATWQHTHESPRHVRGLARIYDVRMAQFVLKIEKLSHIMGPGGSQSRPDGSLRPRLWLLVPTSLVFSTEWGQSTLSSYLCLGWLTSIVPRWQRGWSHLRTNVMDWVLEGNRWPIEPIPQASSALLTKMRQNAALDDINKVRLCYLTQNNASINVKSEGGDPGHMWGIWLFRTIFGQNPQRGAPKFGQIWSNIPHLVNG